MSAPFFGAYALELFGIENISPTFNFVNDLRKDVPVISNGRYRLIDGEYTFELNEEEQKKVSMLNKMIYYKMME